MANIFEKLNGIQKQLAKLPSNKTVVEIKLLLSEINNIAKTLIHSPQKQNYLFQMLSFAEEQLSKLQSNDRPSFAASAEESYSADTYLVDRETFPFPGSQFCG